jgi:hypothetical protein
VSSGTSGALFTPQTGLSTRFSPSVATPQTNIFSAVGQIGAASAGTGKVSVPALAQGAAAQATFAVSLDDFPSSILIPSGATGYVVVSSEFANAPPSGLIVGQPAATVSFSAPASAASAASSVFTLTPGVKYSGARITGTVNVYAAQAFASGTTLTLTVFALLVAMPVGA